MGGGIPRAEIFLLAIFLFTEACGGGGGTGGVQPPPLTPDFSLNLSTNSVSVPQGSTSSPLSVSINPQNNFLGSVQVTFTGLPSGVTTNPPAPFSVAAGQSVPVLFGAASDASTGQFNLTAQATSGALSLAIQASGPGNLPRSAYIGNDSVPLVDTPPGEPHRRHVVFDPANQRIYVVNGAMNRIEVYSMAAANPVLQMTIATPGASSVDLSPDGGTLWVGTSLEQILAIDTAALQVKARYPVSALVPIPGSVFIRPTEGLALSSGKLLVRLRQGTETQALLSLWDPATNTFTNLTSLALAVFQNGVGVLARSGDHTVALVAANDSSGEVAVLNASGGLSAGPAVPLAGAISAAAASPDGSHFAIAVNAGGAAQVLLLDAHLSVLGSYASSEPAGLVFSRDGQSLYVDEPYGNASVVIVLSTSGMQSLGQIPDVQLQGMPTSIEEVGASSNLVGLNNRGLAFLDASQPGSLPTAAPLFASVPAAQPSEGPAAGGTAMSISGTSFSSNPQVRFGATNPVSATVANSSLLQVSSPASAASGPVNLTAYFASGWIALAPSAFSYGPAIVSIFPNAGSPKGGDIVTILGYGFGTNAGSITATLGGNAASVQSVQALPAFASAFGLDSTYPFALECLTLKTPAGMAGKVDLTIQSSTGTTTSPKAFQYLTSSSTYPNPGLHKFILYDQSRQKLFLMATDHVDVFDLNAMAFVNAIEPPPKGPPPDADLRGLALTPDFSQLIVADFGAQSVYLINPDGAAYNGVAVSVGGVAGFPASGPARVTATSAQTVFVGLSGEGGSSTAVCNGCLGQLNLLASPPAFQLAPEPEVSSLTGAPLLQADAAGDVAYLAYDTSPGGPVALWNAATPNVFSLSSANDTATDLVTSSDGTTFAMRAANTTEIRGPDLSLFSTPAAAELETIPNRAAVPGIAIQPSGALIYEPFLDGPPPAAPPATGIHGGIDIRDAHTGQLRLRLYLPEPFAMLNTDVDGLHGRFLTTDEDGQRLFALTTSGLSIVQLASVPLGIGTLAPSSGPAVGGSSVTVRGSGFLNGTTATLGGKPASVTIKDINTMILTTPAMSTGAQQLVLTNPGGETVSLDAAFSAQ